MKRPRKTSAESDRKRNRKSGGQPAPPPRASGRRIWIFRLLAAVGVPVLVIAIIEIALRLAGFGYPTAFLLHRSNQGAKTLIQNNRFGWRFFGPQMARLPYPVSIPLTRPGNTVRIFVLGGSAAYGDPQPRFGLPRMLEAMLSLRFPGIRFEVVNAAMTAINSNVVLPIARDCARADGNIWVIYLGNNEVVGPFGAGTVFGSQVPPLPLIRATLALKKTRTGQLLDAVRGWFEKPPPSKSEWGGMEMFLGQQMRQDDPRMQAVYDYFSRNLADILRAGRRAGVGIVLSTVAVNLKDCAPFASSFRSTTTEQQKSEWKGFYDRGVNRQNAEDFAGALKLFSRAAELDDTVAELRFRQGQCALKLGRADDARREFKAARDLDTLRFRCDDRLNEWIRAVVAAQDPNRVRLADAETRFAESSPDGLPGDDFFYEHVHLTFEGNYLLARCIASEVEKLLPEKVSARDSWPSITDCARRLAWSDWSQEQVLSDVLGRLTDRPFTWQLNHQQQMDHWKELSVKLAPANGPAGISNALTICKAAITSAPDDPELQSQLAALEEQTGDLPAATASARRVVDFAPTDAEAWARLGIALVKEQQFQEAETAFRRAFALDPQDVWSLQNLAQSLLKLGSRDDAVREYRRALAINPRFGLAWLGLGQVLESEGQKAEAEKCYQKALANRIHRAQELAILARFCQSKGWAEAAATNYLDAIKLAPSDPALRIEAGQTLAAWGRHEDAMREYAEAVELAPNSEQARFLFGLSLGKAGKPEDAVTQFREAVRLMPGLIEARLNLGIALVNVGKNSAALNEFERVLQRSPSNPLALRYAEALRKKLSEEPGRQ